ncbi:nadh:ubiquinone oxidoreductase subunit 1/f420h2 oxidoreductase subunit h [Lucifera butyrica]|uniref:Nadh:ubiquinone oxidoreductase subunit 1/f420h2 oxidoreductase subunit h n=1 Tax=Lucifera butyrica TaxID=1351585 RepID=A0A498REK9_9FIRM|nr:NADH-quinone oxidoreductase subunit H [Lucifera butyrica]VBB09759.1 nadh:ubiquinone oxidoreductase subunit 1/f420h2 oxidoreductase subunit h [Lucifera butyrica]
MVHSLAEAMLLQIFQLFSVLFLSPLIKGVLNRWKEFVQGKKGPSIFQVYWDLWKLFHKERVRPESAGWIYCAAPCVYFAAPLIVTMLIPVLTAFPLYMAFAGDMLAGGFILGLGGFFLLLGATAGGSPYAGVGATRARFVSMNVEPVLLLILLCVSYTAHSTIPYVVNQVMAGMFFSPVHILLIAAFFMVFLAETGRIPIDNPSSHHEFSMIGANRLYDYSGPDLALIEWGGAMKYFVLGVILMNVIFGPWGLAAAGNWVAVAGAELSLFLKFLVLNACVVWIESSMGKLRLLRISEYLGAAGGIALFAIILQIVATA